MELRIVQAAPDHLIAWRTVHNEIIPTAPLSEDEVAERAGRHLLTVAYADDTLVGCATVRPPTDGPTTATVIVRVLAPFRRRGFGTAYLAHALEVATGLGAERIETVVLAENAEGLRFARSHGFVEHDRYVLEGQSVPFVDLHLVAEGRPA
ncbi:MAG TPA: GNAT family N-acetyltransferase [Marmoricola sp.]